MENSVHIERGKTEELNDNCLIFAKYTRPQTLKIIHRTISAFQKSTHSNYATESMQHILQQLQKYQQWIHTAQLESSHQDLDFQCNNRNT